MIEYVHNKDYKKDKNATSIRNPMDFLDFLWSVNLSNQTKFLINDNILEMIWISSSNMNRNKIVSWYLPNHKLPRFPNLGKTIVHWTCTNASS